MRWIERILWIITGLGLVLKLLHLPLANFMFIIGTSTLMMIYFFFSWLFLPTPTRKHQHIGLSILAGMALTFLLEGILFKLQVWPLATFNLLFGLSLGGLTAVLTLWITRRRTDLLEYHRAIMLRLVPLMLCGALLYPISASSIMHFHLRGKSALEIELHDQLLLEENPDVKDRIRQRLDSLNEAEVRAEMEQHR